MGYLDYYERVKGEVRRIEESDELREENRELLLDFKRDMKLQGASDSYLHSLLVYCRKMTEQSDKSLAEAEEDGLKDLIEWVEDRDIARATKQDYKKSLKRFLKWWNGGEEYPEKIKWLKTTRKRKDEKLPEKMLKEDDVEALIEEAKNLRDRAFVAVLWETGARIGELLKLKVGSFQEHEHGKKITLDGKTGPRKILLISFLPHLNIWLSEHPRGNDQDAPLWCRIRGEKTGEIVSYRQLTKSLKEMSERAGVQKPVNPHMFRHSRATHLANRLTESQLCQYFGWVQGSDRPATYVHMSGRDLDDDYARINGIDVEGEVGKEKLAPEECPRCGEMNDTKAKFCQKCGLAMDEKTAMEVKRKEVVGELVTEKAEEMNSEGSLDEIIERAVDAKLKEILGDEQGQKAEVTGNEEEKPGKRIGTERADIQDSGGSLQKYIQETVERELKEKLKADKVKGATSS